MRVLVVEDDVSAATAIATALRTAGIVVEQSDTGEDAVDLARKYDFDIIVLDLMLPDMEGYEVLRRMRSAGLETPVLVLSGISGSDTKLNGFRAGADDFITKPFDFNEFKARLEAIVRRSKGYSQPTLRVGSLRVNQATREVAVGDTPVRLTGKEFAILELLLLRKGMMLTKETFLDHLYGGVDEPEIKIIDVFICKLRKKLTEAGADGLIGTVWGQGYILRENVVAPDRHVANGGVAEDTRVTPLHAMPSVE